MISRMHAEMLLSKSTEESKEADETLLKSRQEMLISILSTAKPLTGQGFFNVNRTLVTSMISAATTYIVVLLQFNISETSTVHCTNNGTK